MGLEKKAFVVFFLCSFFGALTGFFGVLNQRPSQVLCFGLFVLAFGALLFWRGSGRHLAIGFLFFVAMMSATSSERQRYDSLLNTLPFGEEVVLEGEVLDITLDAKGRRRALFRARLISSQGQSSSPVLEILLRLSHNTGKVVIAAGDGIRVMGVLRAFQPSLQRGTFDGARFAFARELHGKLSVNHPHAIKILQDQNSFALLKRLRTRLRNGVREAVVPRKANTLLAIMLGDKSAFDDEQMALYRDIGAGHLLAVSGLQVSTLAWLSFRFFLLMGTLSIRFYQRGLVRALASVGALGCTWLFVGICAFPPSAVRAGAMCSAFLVAIFFGRRSVGFGTLSLVGALTLWCSPRSAIDISFVLSYCAVSALILFSKKQQNEGRNRKAGRRYIVLAKQCLWVSFTTSAVTLPLSAFYFGTIALGGLVANALVMPIASFLQLPGIFFGSFGALFGVHWLVEVGAFFVACLEAWVASVGMFLGSLHRIRPLSGFQTLLAIALIIVGLWRLSRGWRSLNAFLIVLAALGLTSHLIDSKALVIDFLPVGQGDGAVMRLPTGQTFVVDGGGVWDESDDPGQRVIVPHLKGIGVGRVDVMVLSHPDPDHILGLLSVIDAFDVGQIWVPGQGDEHPLMRRLRAKAMHNNIPLIKVADLRRVQMFGETKIEIFAPRPEDGQALYDELSANDNSLVMRVEFRGRSILFTGDVEEYGELYLLRDAEDALKSDIIKAPHHGSQTSSSDALLNAAQADHVIFCTGRNNRFGFPHPSVVERYEQRGVTTWNTAEHGEIRIRLVDGKIEFQTHRHISEVETKIGQL